MFGWILITDHIVLLSLNHIESFDSKSTNIFWNIYICLQLYNQRARYFKVK